MPLIETWTVGQHHTARNNLAAFKHKVHAPRNKRLPAGSADAVIEKIDRVNQSLTQLQIIGYRHY